MKEVSWELLSNDNAHHIDSFSSTVSLELENYLKENALKESEIDYSKTYLFFHKGQLAGYATLLSDKLRVKPEGNTHSGMQKFYRKTNDGYTSVPAIKIGRLCVCDNYNSQLDSAEYCGLGKIIFASILNYTINLQSRIGCRVITTHAKKTTQAHEWYKKLGFCYCFNEEKTTRLLGSEETEAIPMFYDIKRIVKD